MAYEVEIKELSARPAAVVSFTAAVSEMGELLGRAFSAVQEHFDASGIEAAGPPFAYTEPLGDNRYAVRAGFPVQPPITGGGEVEAFELPAGMVAVTLHTRSYSRLSEAYRAIEAHAKAQGYEIDPAGASWEEYLSSTDTPASKRQTRVYCPVTQK